MPPVPQAEFVGAVQVFPEQQPVAQEVESQTQTPAWQRWPAVHATPEPHLHAPFEAQVSAPAPHAAQAAAPEPHWETVGGFTQEVPLQHPALQFVESQTQAPPTQVWPTAQAGFDPHWQAPPVQLSERVAGQA